MEAEVPRDLRRDGGPHGTLIAVASRRAAVLGSPIAHSRSPILHRAAYEALDLDWTYDAIDMTPERLPDFLATCGWPDWAGLSLTMPLKTAVLPLLDTISPTASTVAAVNTVVLTERGREGHNTDVAGMCAALAGASAGRDIPLTRGAVIGAGATARSALAALAQLGVRDVVVAARRPEAADEIVALGERLGVSAAAIPWGSAEVLDADAVVSTVPPGGADALAEHVPRTPGVLLDVAYGDGDTPLLRAWRAAEGGAADGLDLLLWQAVDQVRLMTGREPPVEAMRAALEAERPSSGR